MSDQFKRKIEDFECENCGQPVRGDGYTNHCPKCLWSKHVDVFPGDRASNCGGMMRPTKVEYIKGQFEVVHKCEVCGYEKRNRTNLNDDLGGHLHGMV